MNSKYESLDISQVHPHDRYNQHVSKNDISEFMIESAIRQSGFEPKDCRLKKLSGGFQNANYLLEHDGQKRVLRFYSTGNYTALREVGILRFLENQDICTPTVIDFFEIEDKSISVLEFLEGQSLQELLLNSSDIDAAIFFQLGQQLAKIHLIELPRCGFIGPDMKVGNEYDNFAVFLKDYLLRTFNSVAEDRLDRKLRDRLIQLIEDKWSSVLATEPASHLVHCDFNPKNIMALQKNSKQNSQLSITGILDWEFCISGNGYIDIGNFFRFAGDYPAGAEENFIKGYQSVRPKLASNWKEISLLMDLGNMASFLETKEDYQKTFHTARRVIGNTLKYFETGEF